MTRPARPLVSDKKRQQNLFNFVPRMTKEEKKQVKGRREIFCYDGVRFSALAISVRASGRFQLPQSLKTIGFERISGNV